jgi:hypothetical protein
MLITGAITLLQHCYWCHLSQEAAQRTAVQERLQAALAEHDQLVADHVRLSERVAALGASHQTVTANANSLVQQLLEGKRAVSDTQVTLLTSNVTFHLLHACAAHRKDH